MHFRAEITTRVSEDRGKNSDKELEDDVLE